MNYSVTTELTHLASGDYDEHDFSSSDCGSEEEHDKRDTCPKKQGVVGDCHYELYVRQEIIVSANSEQEAEKIAGQRATIFTELDEYLNSKHVTEFDSRDFDGDVISICETDEPEQVKKMIIVHEKLYYDNE